MEEPYNPLEKVNLARSIETELCTRPAIPLGEAANKLGGAGVYVLFYVGAYQPYAALAAVNAEGRFVRPIYVGKAVPEGWRKGGLGADARLGKPLGTRLAIHKRSIEKATNLDVTDFYVRHLVVDDIWIPLGENMLIERHKPLWNRVLDGFGNNTPGKGREKQVKSAWDTLHPGRTFASRLPDNPISEDVFLERVSAYFLSGEVPIGVDDGDAENPADDAGDDL